MNDKLLAIIKEAGFSVSFGNVHVVYNNRQINITREIKKFIELLNVPATVKDAERYRIARNRGVIKWENSEPIIVNDSIADKMLDEFIDAGVKK